MLLLSQFNLIGVGSSQSLRHVDQVFGGIFVKKMRLRPFSRRRIRSALDGQMYAIGKL